MFEQTFKTLKLIREKKNKFKDQVKKQKKELEDLIPFEAKRAMTLKVINMAFEKTPGLTSITIETDPTSEAIVNEYIEKELGDYIVKKREDNPLLYDIRIKQIDL